MRQTSKVTVKVDGDAFRSKAGSSSLKIGGLYRTETEMTDQGVFLYKEKYVPSELKTTVMHVADTDLIKIRDSKDVSVTYETDTGAVYTITNAVCTEIGDLKDGEVECSFQGDAAKS